MPLCWGWGCWARVRIPRCEGPAWARTGLLLLLALVNPKTRHLLGFSSHREAELVWNSGNSLGMVVPGAKPLPLGIVAFLLSSALE